MLYSLSSPLQLAERTRAGKEEMATAVTLIRNFLDKILVPHCGTFNDNGGDIVTVKTKKYVKVDLTVGHTHWGGVVWLI